TDTANNTPISGGTSNSVKIFRCHNTTGLSISKTCPAAPLAPGTPFSCTFSVTNLDPAHTVINLAVTNTVPFPGGTTTSTVCNQGGSPVTTLGAKGTATDTCTGSVDEVSPDCGPSTIFYQDKVAATGIDTGINSPVSASTTNSVRVLACPPTNTPTATPTPTPTNTPTDTPTNTPTHTQTNTPTKTPTNTPTNTPTDTPANAPTT